MEIKILVEEIKEMYAVLDNAIQNSDHTDFEQCYSALAELCERALCGLDKYKGVASVPDLIKMFKRDIFVLFLLDVCVGEKQIRKKNREREREREKHSSSN